MAPGDPLLMGPGQQRAPSTQNSRQINLGYQNQNQQEQISDLTAHAENWKTAASGMSYYPRAIPQPGFKGYVSEVGLRQQHATRSPIERDSRSRSTTDPRFTSGLDSESGESFIRSNNYRSNASNVRNQYRHLSQYLKPSQDRISEEDSIEYSSSSRGYGTESEHPKSQKKNFQRNERIKIIGSGNLKRKRRKEAGNLLSMIGQIRSSDEPWRRENLEISSLRADFSSRVRRGFLQGIISKHLGSRPTEVRYHQHRCFYNHHPLRNLEFRVDEDSSKEKTYQR